MAKLKTSTKPVRSSRNISKPLKKNEITFEEYSPTAKIADEEFISKVIWECLKDNDVEGVIDALRTFVDAQNKLQISKSENISRSTIYDSLKPGANPTLKTLAKLVHGFTSIH